MSSLVTGEKSSLPGGVALRLMMITLLVCVSYYVGGIIAIALRFQPGGISGIWLPHGILVAVLLLTPVRQWWLFAAALLPTHLHLVSSFQGPVPLLIMLIQFGGNMTQAVLGAAPLRRFLGDPPRLNSLSRMSAFIVVAALLAPCLVSALVAWLFTVSDWVGDFWITWQRRSFALMCAAVIVTPAIIHLAAGGLVTIRRASLRQKTEFLLLTVGLIAVLLASFGWDYTRPHHRWLPFASLPLLLWSAVRFGPGGLGPHLLAVTLVALLITKAGRGPFAAGSPAEVVVALQGFFLVLFIPMMLLTALVQEHAQAAAALRQSQAQYRSVVEDQTELICRFLHDGTYTFVNGAYCRHLQRRREELIGQNFWQFIPAEQHPDSRAFLSSITPEHPLATIEHQVVGPAGEVRWQQWIDRGFFDEHGRIIEYQAVGQDITERKRAEDEHRQLLAQKRVAGALREVDRRKDEFLAMLAHELRNPLAPIGMAVEIMRMSEQTDQNIVWARDVIDRQAAQLTRLVDELLDVSRITLGKIRLNLTLLDLDGVITQSIETSRPLLIARQHELSVDKPGHPLPVLGDGVRLTQVISNLLSNAAKYTGDGGRIALTVREVGAQVIMTVADNGVGMPTDMLERVFDMFTQLDGPGGGSQGGLGIGLALVKRLVEMHHGAIEARSDGPGRGSEFVVRLPLAIEQWLGRSPEGPAHVGEQGEHALPPASERKRILVVDDNIDAAESLARLLRLQEHEVLVAHDGLAALAAAGRLEPDVIFLDIGLPELDGLAVARRLRQRAEGSRALLVATTGFGQAEDRARTAAAGFDHHLTKPIDLQMLRSLVRSGSSREPWPGE